MTTKPKHSNWIDPDDAPAWTSEDFRKATWRIGDKAVTRDEARRAIRRGRPFAKDPRKQVTIRLPESVLARWRSSGAGWQTRMAEVLEQRAP
ncbi:MAG: BrnA antitoxin family protein [Rhodanobacteraceae bacterium]